MSVSDQNWMDDFSNGVNDAAAAELTKAENEIGRLFPTWEPKTIRSAVQKIAGELLRDSRLVMNAETIVLHFKSVYARSEQRK